MSQSRVLPSRPDPRWTAVVLAGGRAQRMGGQPKPQLTLDGRSLIAWVVDALPTDVPLVVVGPSQPVPRPAVFCREEPAFGGPVAALAAALPYVGTAAIGLIGADMPHAGALLARLCAGWSDGRAIVPVDTDGRRQPLCCVLPTAETTAAIAEFEDVEGRSMRDLLALLDVVEYGLSVKDAPLLRDVDVPSDLTDL